MNSGGQPSPARCVLIAVNPKSGSGSTLHLTQQLKSALEKRGFAASWLTCLQQLQRDAQRLAAENRLAAVVAAGGDGTVSLLANLLPATVPLLIFPVGTENLLARYWGMTNDVEAACNTLMGGRVIHMDVGSANGKLFLVMLSCGFDADVVQRMHSARKGHIQRWMYTWPILRSISNYRFPRMRFDTSEGMERPGATQKLTGSAPWLFLFNVPRYAASLQICPQADPTDGKLDLCTFGGSGIFSGLFYLFQLWRGTHEQLSEFQHTQVKTLSILPASDPTSSAEKIPFQIDGDPGGVLPLHVEILPGRLKLLVPESTATGDPLLAVSMAAAT